MDAFTDMLERKIEDMSRQLAEERQNSRQNKMATTRLQRELARAKSQGKSTQKEHLSRELEHEKMLRLEAERKLHEMTRENEACHSRLENLQAEFLRMETVVQELRQYKSKIDQLRQEKTSLSSTYETSLQKFKGHITELERENMVLLNEVKKLESQMSSKAGSQDRYRLLLERLKMVETENSSLVLENEQQRGQYEKCLDEIANQVVQALLAQKMLREECVQLQDRVQELECQNRHLCIAYSARVWCGSDSNSQDGGVFVAGSLDSLHSMFSEQTADVVGCPQMSSPPPWLQDRLPGDRRSLVSFTGSVVSTPDIDTEFVTERNNQSKKFKCRTEIETEFPATPSSPKSKHVSIMDRTSEATRSSSTSSLLPSKVGPNRQRTRSTSSLSRACGLTSSQPTDHGLHDSGHSTNRSTTNQTSQVVCNQGNTPSSMSFSSQGQTPTIQVHIDHLSTLANSQGQMQSSQTSISSSSSSVSLTSSKIPVLPVGQTKEDLQLRRNSLKAEYSIRLGNQSTTLRNTPSPKPGIPTLRPPRPSSQGQRSVAGQGHTHSRSPSASGRSQSAGSKIPSVFSKPARTSSKENVSKVKSGSESIKPVPNSKSGSNTKLFTNASSTSRPGSEKNKCATSASASKLVPPKSPLVKHSGIKTTLKTSTSGKLVSEQDSKSTNSMAIQNSQAALKSVYCIKTVPSTAVANSCRQETAKPALPVCGNKPLPGRGDSHFPIMGLTTLSHTSPKSEESATKIYENVQTPVNCSSPKDNQCSANSTTESRVSNNSVANTNVSCVNQSGLLNSTAISGRLGGSFIENETCMTKKPNYFYDYSDEDSDCQVTRSPSKDFGSVSTISLEELLDRTLENMDTPNGSEFSSGYLAFNSTQMLTESVTSANSMEDKGLNNAEVVKSSDNTHLLGNFVGKVSSKNSPDSHPVGNNLGGKPDIVKDTEHSEQMNLQKNMPVSEIPGSSLPGYRAKRPKSLILGSKEKKFLYCEYGSSSGSDSSDNENWSCKFSYAKNVKEEEIQSKVAKCVKNGEAKIIESPKGAKSKGASIAVKKEKDSKVNSSIPKPSAIKKPSKIPPPVASKPVSKLCSIPKIATSSNLPRPKSEEICINTALSTIKSKPTGYFESPNPKDLTKAESEHSLSSKMKLSSSELNSVTTFEEVKVERSGSKDDGYSTMSSDIQPEMLEKYSDAFESSTNSNEARNSNLSLSSQNSYSSEDRLSGHGSLGRVKAMKLKFELDNQKSDSKVSPTKSPPLSPAKSLLKAPKPVSEKYSCKYVSSTLSEEKTGSNLCKIPKPKSSIPVVKDSASQSPKPKCSIPASSSTKSAITKQTHKVEITIEPKVEMVPKEISPQSVQRKSFPITNPNYITSTPVRQVSLESPTTPKLSPIQPNIPLPHIINHVMPAKVYADPFDKLALFDNIELLKDPNFDSNSSLSNRASDLTSLHISEENMLSDIPEEKDGYESSVGVLSENTSFASLPTVNIVKKPPQHTPTHTNANHSHHNTQRHPFTQTLKRYWSSCAGIVRAASISDYEKQKKTKESADYEELYGGCLNIETLLERASSESDMYTRGDKPLVNLLPLLQRSLSADDVRIDEIVVEERVQAILKHSMMTQISQNVESADRDGESFTSFVELLIKRGHVMGPSTPQHENLTDMAVSNFSSKGNNSCPNSFASEERTETELPPLGEDQKRFNCQFYSLCNTGSNRSISDRTDGGNNDPHVQLDECQNVQQKSAKTLVHTCHKGYTKHCKKCEKQTNIADFDNISKKIESLSKTVNELHRSLSSLNSDNSEASCSESNEGDFPPQNAIGNKDIDGYAWVEDEFFLSPYDGEIILGTSPFSKTGASCDWMDNYVEEADHFEELGGQEAPLDDSVFELPVSVDPVPKYRTSLNSMSHDEKYAQTRRSIISGCMDTEGNFDTESFISQRLLQEEERLKSKETRAQLLQFSQDMDISVPIQNVRSSVACPGMRSRPLHHGGQQASGEQAGRTAEQMGELGYRFDVPTLARTGSQDSLDDNIGVDNVMCHRLLGGKGSTTPGQRSALEFNNRQFVRYEDPEKQAIAAFDFLQEMTSSMTSHASNQSNCLKQLHDQDNQTSANEIKKSRIPRNFRPPMSQSTTSTEEQLSPVKRQRRKVKRGKKEQGFSKLTGKVNTRKCSSTSNDESNDASATDSSSEVEFVPPKQQLSSKMTYL